METITGTEFIARMKQKMEESPSGVDKELLRVGIIWHGENHKPGSISTFGNTLKVIW